MIKQNFLILRCGIFGAIVRDSNQLGDNKLTNLVNTLFVLSETRGKEAAGIAIRTDSSIEIYKDAKNAKSFVKTDKFKKVLKDSFEKVHTGNDIFSFIGHSRLVTNGAHSNNNNNQLATNNQIAVHNGIITNESELWELNSDLKKETDLDTEILLKFFDKQFQKNKNIDESLKKHFLLLKGLQVWLHLLRIVLYGSLQILVRSIFIQVKIILSLFLLQRNLF